ncbi:hypothetical protein EMCRGX_G025829 [Ephydatia muelleri]
MSMILGDMDGVVDLIDDILVFSKTQAEHDRRLDQVLQRLLSAELTLNASKCEFSKTDVRFLGHVVSNKEGINLDPEKIKAITLFPEPQVVGEIRWFLWIVNQLSKFSPHIAQETKPLRDLLSVKNSFIEIAHLDHTTTEEVIVRIKAIFARHGIPEELISDNRPQFSSHLFLKFSQEYGFDHITSSPLFSQSNGEAERAVKTIKTMWKKTSDSCLALLSYRATPLQNCYSPAELLMSRKLRTTVPIIEQESVPKVPNRSVVRETKSQAKGLQKNHFDHHHRVTPR